MASMDVSVRISERIRFRFKTLLFFSPSRTSSAGSSRSPSLRRVRYSYLRVVKLLIRAPLWFAVAFLASRLKLSVTPQLMLALCGCRSSALDNRAILSNANLYGQKLIQPLLLQRRLD